MRDAGISVLDHNAEQVEAVSNTARETKLTDPQIAITRLDMQIRRLKIRRYRGLEIFDWDPAPGMNSLVGPGDTGKSTVLAAVSLLLAPYPIGAASEFDYYKRRVGDGFEIEACIGALDLAVLTGERQVLPLRGWLNGQVMPLPDEAGAEAILVCRVRGTADMEVVHELLVTDDDVTTFSVALRKRLSLALISGDDRTPRDLRLSPGSVLDRFLGRTDIRPALHRAIAGASENMELPDELHEPMERLRTVFEEAGLPSALCLGIVPSLGTSLAGTAALLNGDRPAEAVPLALAGSGTRSVAEALYRFWHARRTPLALRG